MIFDDATENARGGESPIDSQSPWSEGIQGRAQPGDRVGRFRILEEIGFGGMGVVYKALDEQLGRHVALKHPRMDVADPETVRARFVREARAASRLLHPNVVPIFEVFELNELSWLAMEFVEGGSLRDRLKESGPMPLVELLKHAEGLASALASAHQLDILHRDVKPANVLLDRKGTARLVDFGLARSLLAKGRDEEETITRLTQEGRMVGTPGYMSPEQALGRSLDARSDIFCLGLVIYEMCTSRQAVEKGDSQSWLDNLLHIPFEPIAPVRPDTPEALEDIIFKTLSKRPEERYQTADALAEDIESLRLEVEAGLSRKRVFRSRWLGRIAMGIGLTALVVAGFAGSWYLKDILAPTRSATPWVAKPLTHDPAWAADPAMSPDETMIAYASGRSGNGDIWLIDREGGSPLQLTDHPSADRRPAWLATGSHIFFTSFRSGEAAIWRVPRLGGTPELVLPDADDPALSPDGTQLAFVRRDGSGHYRVAVAPLDDLEGFRFLTTSEDGYWFHRNPKFSPDGKMISYNSSQGLWVVPLGGGPARRLDYHEESMGKAGWAGKNLIYSKASFRKTSAIWQVGLKQGDPIRLSAGAGCENQVSPSADGKAVVFSSLRNGTTLIITDHVTGETTELGDVTNPDMPSMAPDGSALVFWGGFREGDGLFLQHLEKGRPVGKAHPLMARPGYFALPVFSPDGRWLAFQQAVNDQRDIWTIPVDGGTPKRFTTHEAADGGPFFSPDGTHLAFSSNRSGRYHIWWAPIKDGVQMGDPVQLTFEETTDYLPRISPDGKLLAWLGNRDDEENLWVRSLIDSSDARALTDGRRIRHYWWEPRGDVLLACGDWDGAELSLRRVSTIDEPEKPAADRFIDFGRGNTGGMRFSSGAFSLSSDGRFSVHTKTEMTGDLWLMEEERSGADK